MSKHKIFRSIIQFATTLLLGTLLAACGAGGGDRASANNAYSISGVVSGATGVTITLSGAAKDTVTSDGSGKYSINNLANGKYTVTPSKPGYSFNPGSREITVSSTSVSGTDFTAILNADPTYTLSGTVTGAAMGKSVLITLSAQGKSTTATIDTNNSYSFPGLSNGVSYTATPSLAGYSFTPLSSTILISNSNARFDNFDSVAVTVAKYTIAGTVSGTTGVTIALSGDATQTLTTGGNYSFPPLVNGKYTVTPSKPGFTFNPSSFDASVSGANVTVTTFVAKANTAPTYILNGRVTGDVLLLNANNNVLITLSGAGNATTTSNSLGGDFSFANLPNGTYTATPSFSGYTFNPKTVQATISGQNATFADLVSTALPLPTYSITGTVSGTTQQGVSLSLTGAANKTATSDVNGVYSFTGLANGSYSVTPSKTGYSFTPNNTAVNVSGVNVTGQNFTASTNALPTYKLDGTVSGDVLQNVLITLSGKAKATTLTNTTGNYSFQGLLDGAYTLTPTLNGYTFNPGSLSATVSGIDLAVSGFIATKIQAPTYTISGKVSGATSANVTITLTGAATMTTTTAADGSYSLSGLASGNYVVTPAQVGFAFTPGSTTVNNLNANTTANFSSTAVVTTCVFDKPTSTFDGGCTFGI